MTYHSNNKVLFAFFIKVIMEFKVSNNVNAPFHSFPDWEQYLWHVLMALGFYYDLLQCTCCMFEPVHFQMFYFQLNLWQKMWSRCLKVLFSDLLKRWFHNFKNISYGNKWSYMNCFIMYIHFVMCILHILYTIVDVPNDASVWLKYRLSINMSTPVSKSGWCT